MNETPEHIFLALPSYDGRYSAETVSAMLNALPTIDPLAIYPVLYGTTALCKTFNDLWAGALNLRERLNIRWFVLLHADMGSLDAHWLMKLIRGAEQLGLDVVSAVAAIKDSSKDTSCALFDADGFRHRLSLEEVGVWPPILSAEWVRQGTGLMLAINTGMMAVRFDRPWCEEFAFAMQDGISRGPDGKFAAWFIPEDWGMSRWLDARGIPYGVHTGVHTVHMGGMAWHNQARPAAG